MTNTDRSKFIFPVGYHKFHKKQVFNFQLNRWYSLGYARFEDIKEVSHKVKSFKDWKTEMVKLAEKAESENRLMNAAFYYRASEFYMLQDNFEKKQMYNKFIDLFYKAFKNDNIEQFEVPYKEAFLPAMKVSPKGDKKKGIIVMHGGFDSFIEEFYSWIRYFSDHGYEVIAFEGPGQGAALRKHGFAVDYEWEKPIKAVLDYFKLNDVTLVGISMGGWFCFRAAAFEPRIKRVIASSISYDYMKLMKKKEKGIQAWMSAQLMYITKKQMPMDAFDFWLQLNEKNLHSELVKQDVLILTGRNDHFISFKAHAMQVKALTNANSVTAKVFTKETHAHNHCQIGNIGLALDVMVKWIEEKS